MRWIPIEANPEIINHFMVKIGVDNQWQCVDVYGTEPDLLEFIPRPVISLLLLYPLTDVVMNNPIGEVRNDNDVIFIKQTIGNACGTIGLLHSLCNNQEILGFQGDSYISNLVEKLIPLSPDNRAKVIEEEEFLSTVHEEVALDGQSAAPNSSVKTDLHFVSFIYKNGGLYELDGRSIGPRYHGPCNEDTFLYSAIDVIKKFISRDPNEHNFNVIAIVKNE